MLETLQAAASSTLTPHVLLVILASAIFGIFVGSIPGLTATMAVALMVPITFFLDDISSVAAIVTTVTCSIFAGDIPGALVRIPGTPASAAYTMDAYAITQSGRPELPLGISLVFSIVGGLFGVVVLLSAAPQLARIEFTSYEYFWLCALGLSCAAVVSQGSKLKGALALLIGLMISTVGLSTDHGVPRFTTIGGEQIEGLYGGINFIPAMIGLFGVSEVLRNVLKLNPREKVDPGVDSATGDAATTSETNAGRSWLQRNLWDPIHSLLADVLPILWLRRRAVLRSSLIGSLVGMLPGAGADLAAWISYAVSKRLSRKPRKYGRGSVEGISDATSANNSALASAWIPALVFGIPGDSVTAIALGVLMMKNIEPGPDIFTDPVQAPLVYGLYLTFILANLVLLPIGLLAIRAGSLLVRIPRRVLLPLILVFCILGAFAIRASYIDLWILLTMGVLGFILETYSVPLGPVVLGIILGEELEHRLIQSLTKSDGWTDFITRPASATLAFCVLALWLTPPLVSWWKRRQASLSGE